MWRIIPFVVGSMLVLVLVACDATARSAERESQQAALDALRPFDPVVQFDERKADRPVIGIQFRPNVTPKVTDADLVHLQTFPALRVLELSSNPITDAGLAHLEKLTQLEELNLNWNHISADAVARLIKGREKLRVLTISGVSLGDEQLAEVGNLHELQVLGLRGSNVTDAGLARLAPLTKLRKLSLMNTSVGDAGLEHLAALAQLEDLDLDRTAITDAGLKHLASLKNLSKLQMAHTRISDVGLESLRGLSQLSALHVAGTRVTQAGVDKIKPGLAKINSANPDVVMERLTGGIAFRPENRGYIRITGHVTVIDAHTLLFEDGTEADLDGGMQAPEIGQLGRIDGRLYPCGIEAARFLRDLIGDRKVACMSPSERVTDKRMQIANAFVGEMNLNIEMVRNGWAISHHRGMDDWEIIAREHKRGLWRGEFVVPERWLEGERLPGEATVRPQAKPGEKSKPSERTTAGADGVDRSPASDAADSQKNNRRADVARVFEAGQLTKIKGKVQVLDAHTIEFEDGTQIELNGGMDAPDLPQQGNIGDDFYPCGERAANFLKNLVGTREVIFYFEGRRGDKLHGDCFVGETCLQIEMVRNGWAVSHHTGMDSWQSIASENKRGLWRGSFVLPEQWRKRKRLDGEAKAVSPEAK
jgi:endonuclease YncB( thermonuclease family)